MVGNRSGPALALSALAIHAATALGIPAHDAVADDEHHHHHHHRRLRTSSANDDDDDGRRTQVVVVEEEGKRRRSALLRLRRRSRRFANARGHETTTTTKARNLDCIRIGWHMDLVHENNGCTDDDNYPKEWIDHLEIRERMFRDTAQECCDEFYPGGDCRIRDGGCRTVAAVAVPRGGGTTAMKAALGDGTMMAEQRRDDGPPPCEWHPSQTGNSMAACSYSDSYPEAWDNPQWRHNYLFESHAECCRAAFDLADCAREDLCEAAARPTDQPVGPPAERPLEQGPACEWHPSQTSPGACAHSDSYPQAWDDPQWRHNYLYDSHAECCRGAFGSTDCTREDLCEAAARPTDQSVGPPAEQPLEQGPACEWHRSQSSPGTCAHSDSYPEGWDDPQWRHNFLFDTHAGCCEGSFGTTDCPREDLCETTATTRPAEGPPAGATCAWHPSQTLSGACAHSDSYPEAWDDPQWRHNYLFDTHAECCEKSFGTTDCTREDICETTGFVLEQQPAAPTFAPTSAPTSIFFVDHFSGLCLDAAFNTQPHYITQTHPTFRDCCEASFAQKACLAAQPDDLGDDADPELETSIPTYSPTVVLYYVEHFTGMCVDATGEPVPHYVLANETFVNYWNCCRTSFARDKCLDQYPEPEPTAGPTAYVAPVPSQLPSSSPSGRPSVASLRPTEWDCSDAKWRYDPEHVDGCTNLETSASDDAVLLFQSWQECCQEASFSRWRGCRVDDRCRTDAVAIPFEARPRVESVCDDDDGRSPRRYHPDAVNKDGCTDSPDFPDSWNAAANGGAGIFFDSAIECCKSNYLGRGLNCNVRNTCAVVISDAPTSQPTPTSPCRNRMWHPDTDPNVAWNMIGCSNSVYYPDAWIEDGAGMLFDTAEECCELHYTAYGLQCHVHDLCLVEEQPLGDFVDLSTTTSLNAAKTCSVATGMTSSCPSAKWHLSQDFSKCTNDLDFQPSWEDSDLCSLMFFDKAAECCINVFNYENCPSEDICVAEKVRVLSMMPSQEPSISTEIPSPQPSTMMPSPGPSIKMQTSAPIPASLTMDDSSPMDHCSGEGRRKCKGPMCIWDAAERLCALVDQNLSTPPPSAPIPASLTMDASSPMDHCSGEGRRKCKGPMCIWDASQRLCALVDQNLSTPPPSSNVAASTPTEDATASHCADRSRKQCSKVSSCDWNKSLNSCVDFVNDRGCQGKRFHPRTAADRTCSNDEEYPEFWDKPGMSAAYLLPSADQCCKAFYADGPCNIVDVCSAVN